MLEHWLSPVTLRSFPAEAYHAQQLRHQLLIHSEEGLPDLQEARVALVGLDPQEAAHWRKALYPLADHFGRLKIADLGDLRKGSVESLIPTVRELLHSGIFPLLIGGEGSYLVAQYRALRSDLSSINLTLVDERIRYATDGIPGEESYLQALIDEPDAALQHFTCLGYQRHFTLPTTLHQLEDKHFDMYRLGKARADLTELEPPIRDADILGIHLESVRQSEAMAVRSPSPSGFSGDELCQISRYAGMSDKLKSMGIFGFLPKGEQSQATAQLLAQIIWYFLDGFAHRQGDFPASVEGLIEYIVDIKNLSYQLTFWKSQRTGRWWMQLPVEVGGGEQRHRLVPCSYADYKLASRGELPNRLINALRRFG